MKNKKKNKTWIWLILIAVAIIGINVIITEVINANNRRINPITVDQYLREIAGKQESVVLLTNNNCSDCDKVMNNLKDVKANVDVPIYYINVDELKVDDYGKLLSSSDALTDMTFPLVVHISGGAVIDTEKGVRTADELISFIDVFKKISIGDYDELSNDEEEHYIYIGRPTCSACVATLPGLKRIASELDDGIYYINTDEATNSQLQNLINVTKEKFAGSTPTFLLTKDGEILDSRVGGGDYDQLKEFFTKE